MAALKLGEAMPESGMSSAASLTAYQKSAVSESHSKEAVAFSASRTIDSPRLAHPSRPRGHARSTRPPAALVALVAFARVNPKQERERPEKNKEQEKHHTYHAFSMNQLDH